MDEYDSASKPATGQVKLCSIQGQISLPMDPEFAGIKGSGQVLQSSIVG
jgi:hypothetical protein